jgi:hypothetical protein
MALNRGRTRISDRSHVTRLIMIIKTIRKKTLFESGDTIICTLKTILENISLFVMIVKYDIILIINVLIGQSLF